MTSTMKLAGTELLVSCSGSMPSDRSSCGTDTARKDQSVSPMESTFEMLN